MGSGLKLIPAKNVAQLILVNMAAFNRATDKQLDSFSISKGLLRFLSNRETIRGAFLDELKACLLELGYVLIIYKDGATRYAVISLDRIRSFRKLGAKYVRNAVDDLDDLEDIEDAYNEFFGSEKDYEDEEEDEDD